MKKFVPYFLFSVTTFHTFLVSSPVIAMGCDSHSDKSETICDEGDTKCFEKISSKSTN